MKLTGSPTRAACFRPDDYEDLKLFANRAVDRQDLIDTLESYLSPGGPGECRIMIRGDRGVGKSLLTRAAVQEIVDRHGPLKVVVDAAQTGHGPDAFMKQLCQDLAREITENVPESHPDIRKSAEILWRLSRISKISVKEARQWSQALQITATLTSKFLDRYQLQVGLTRGTQRTRTVEESYEQPVDVGFLGGLLQDLILDCRAGREGSPLSVLLFLDNLDQVGYGELQEDVERVSNLARQLLGIRGAVIVANLRSEFVSADLRKSYSVEKRIEGMQPAHLREIAQQRMRMCSADRQDRLKAAGFETIVEQLSHFTTNAWSFLSWLAFLDQERLDFTPADTRALRETLLRFALRRHAHLQKDELEHVGAVYRHSPNAYQTQSELDRAGIQEELLKRAVRCGALIPDLLLQPDRYTLSPVLHFLVVQPG